MTHMTETGRIHASGRRSLQWGGIARGAEGPSTRAGIPIARSFAPRGKCGVLEINTTEDRAFPRGGDS
jgi:hypothetical protein